MDFTFEVRDSIGYGVFNRPQARNALTFAMYESLAVSCAQIEADRGIRALVLTGAGDKAFAAGTDISQFRAFSGPQDAIDYENRIDRVISAVEALRLYCEAAQLDDGDIVLWNRMGTLVHYSIVLARFVSPFASEHRFLCQSWMYSVHDATLCDSASARCSHSCNYSIPGIRGWLCADFSSDCEFALHGRHPNWGPGPWHGTPLSVGSASTRAICSYSRGCWRSC